MVSNPRFLRMYFPLSSVSTYIPFAYKIRCSPNRFLPIKIDLRLVYGISKEEFTFFITEWDKKILDLYGYPYEIIDYIGIKTEGKLVLPDLHRIYEKKKEINDFSKQTKVFSPYVSWINVNPELAENIFSTSMT